MTQRRLLILGNSHTKAIKSSQPPVAGVETYWVRSRKEGAPGDIDLADARDLAAGLTPDDFLAVMWLGTLHNIVGLLNHDPPFALIDGKTAGDGKQAGDAAEIVPEAVMRSFIRNVLTRDTFLTECQKITRARIGHVMPPPPKQDLSALLDTAKMYRGKQVADVGFAPARQRLAFWALEQRTLAEFLGALGITPIGPPPGTTTGQGFLHTDYAAGDATHANAAYGARLTDHIRTTMERAAVRPLQGAERVSGLT